MKTWTTIKRALLVLVCGGVLWMVGDRVATKIRVNALVLQFAKDGAARAEERAKTAEAEARALKVEISRVKLDLALKEAEVSQLKRASR